MILYFACFFEVLESAKGEHPSKYSFLPSGWPQLTRMLSEIEDFQNHHPLLEYIILEIHSKVAHKWLGLMLNFPVFKWLIISTIKQRSKDPYTWETRNSSHMSQLGNLNLVLISQAFLVLNFTNLEDRTQNKFFKGKDNEG